jgi:hypothetical protein
MVTHTIIVMALLSRPFVGHHVRRGLMMGNFLARCNKLQRVPFSSRIVQREHNQIIIASIITIS